MIAAGKHSNSNWLREFRELTKEEQKTAGGKGGTLARLYQAGYPVPDGFILMPNAFNGDDLVPEAWNAIQKQLIRMRTKNKDMAFAIRSSALAEDSIRASFAGEFETVLDVNTDDEVREAIKAVRKSRRSERVQTYSAVKGIDTVHEMAVIIQQLVPAEMSGVLFTADPVTGNRMVMTGNFIHGLGDKLVSGETTGEEFVFERPKGRFKGPVILKKHSKKLYKLAERVEKEFNFPQDIEFAIASGKLYLVQSRPVSTLVGYDPVKGLWNDTLTGDYLWTNVNVAEATPEVMTPSTWSFNTVLSVETATVVKNDDCPIEGNICGRPYVNLSYLASSFGVIPGMDFKKSVGQYEETMGRVPDIPRIPLYPYRLRSLIKDIPGNIRIELFGKKFIKNRYEFVEKNPKKCQQLKERIDEATAREELLSFWNEELYPYFVETCWTLRFVMKSATSPTSPTTKLRKKLVKLAGEEQANILLANLAGIEDQLASLGPVLGLSRIIDGELSREAYMEKYGHRSPQEIELFIPRPYEDPDWLDWQLEDYKRSNVDVKDLLSKRHAAFSTAWEKLKAEHPKQVKKIQKKIKIVTRATIDREDVRSGYVRVWCVIREFLLKVGTVTGLGEDVFFLTREEILDLLSGDGSSKTYIPARRDTYEKYRALPPYPAWIIGRFDPLEWVKDPIRRSDLFDSQGVTPQRGTGEDMNVIKGLAGSMGRTEGYVRVLKSPEEGHELQPGEILVATTTNVGWTLLFPRAAAIVTDVGAILSHAAIVARELGIPAVVGCGNATTRLRTGDRVMVDGGTGIVEILESG
ncbi:MAG: PEP/pyruvate-binding domain-containing protein [Candidatus Odinarchaeota archaeon]